MNDRHCFRNPIPEIAIAARHLDDAVTAFKQGKTKAADSLFRAADIKLIRDWTESIWGKNSSYVTFYPNTCTSFEFKKTPVRMPTNTEKRQLHFRDGYHCRFCNIPVIRKEVRIHLRKSFPEAIPWGRRNAEQHAAFQCMWAQYDHILPHSKGGTNELENLVITCAPCNFGRMNYSLAEVGLSDPRMRLPIKSNWDGLERSLLK